jgi:hypothetical protein
MLIADVGAVDCAEHHKVAFDPFSGIDCSAQSQPAAKSPDLTPRSVTS